MVKICHIADIHIRNNERHEEYSIQFEKLYKVVKENNIDIVAIVGDLLDNFIEISNEAEVIAGEFLNKLAELCEEVIIVHGNHELRKKNLNRINSVDSIVRLINNPKITYFGKSNFYKDKLYDIVWVNHSHSEKNINPWRDMKHIKINGKTYIDLFHDPINDCTNDDGYVFKNTNLRNIADFKGDIVLMGDIHKYQHFRKNKTGAYSSSLIQQNFGERVENHGCIIWEIDTDIDYKFVHIDNDYTFNNFYIPEGTDYNNLNLTTPEKIGKFPQFKVHWTDLSSNINTENERLIRKQIKKVYGTTKVKFDKTYIYTDIVSSKMLSESLDLTNSASQRKIFKDYLKEQGYKKVDIEEILKIDDIVNEKLDIKDQKTNIEWSIEKFWFDNFKAFGDDNVIDWRNLDGIIQVHGANQQGKTTILDVITYVLYGATTTTEKREKHGDNRYINNKRDLDKCSGGMIINIDGEKVTLVRETERKWNRKKTALSSCSTHLDYYDGEIINDKYKLTGEKKTSTQKMLDEILGDFKDFVRLSLTNADNLNDLLSSDRSVFIDSIIKDAGYDIFEKKLNEYKLYKKGLNEEKIIIDVSESEERKKELQLLIKENDEKIDENLEIIRDYKKDADIQNSERDKLMKDLNKIDESMKSFDVAISEDTKKNYQEKIKNDKVTITIYEREIGKLPSVLDTQKLETLKVNLKALNIKESSIKDEISTVNQDTKNNETKIEKVKGKLRELRDNEISNYKEKINNSEKEISEIEAKKLEIVNSTIIIIKDEIKKCELEKLDIDNKRKGLQKDGLSLKNRNEEIETEIEELKNSKDCPTCGRELDNDPEHIKHILQSVDKLKESIKDNKSEVRTLRDKYNKLTPKSDSLTFKIIKLKSVRDNISKGDYFKGEGEYYDTILDKFEELGDISDIESKIEGYEAFIKRLSKNDFTVTDSILKKYEKGKSLIKKAKDDNVNNLKVIENFNSELKNLNIESVEVDIQNEEKVVSNFALRKEKIALKSTLLSNIENYKLKLAEIEETIKKYNDQSIFIKENADTQLLIDDVDSKISDLNDSVDEVVELNSDIKKDNALYDNEFNIITNRIKDFLKQKRKEELMKEYQRCISRDGIPTYLLRKSLHLINKELNELLTNVDFTLFFDDNLNLKLSMDDRLDVSQNAIESSGKERTFCALSLKIALRQINIKSRPNLIILDEIMGKLYENSVNEFIDLLDEIKNKIDKIIIIEHVNPINYDGLITVSKSDDLTSTLITDF